MTCPKCGTELETYECDRTNSTHTIPHRPSQCFAALVKQRDYWKELSNKFSLAPELARIEAAEARAAELEAKLEIAREALELIDHVYGGSKTARDALAALAKETENA